MFKLAYTTQEAQEATGISRNKLLELKDRGYLRPLKIGNVLIWPHEDIKRFLELNKGQKF